MSTTPRGLVSPDTPFGSTPPLEASTPPARPPTNIPTFITPPEPPSIPPVWEHVIDVLMKLPTTTAEGQKHEILGHLPFPYISRGLLNVGIGHTPI